METKTKKERKTFGQYVVTDIEPETPEKKKEYVKECISRLIDSTTAKVRPDWNTFQVIIHEGIDTFCSPDWYAEEKEGYKPPKPQWMMTVAVKFRSDDYDFELEESHEQ